MRYAHGKLNMITVLIDTHMGTVHAKAVKEFFTKKPSSLFWHLEQATVLGLRHVALRRVLGTACTIVTRAGAGLSGESVHRAGKC